MKNSTRNLWPIGVIAAFVVFIAGTVGLVIFASTQHSDLVTAGYYEEEVRFQSQLDRTRRARQLESQACATYDPAGNRITISLPPGHAASAVGQIQLYRPSAAGLDRHFPLQLDAGGTQTIPAAGLKDGLWKVKVTWTAGGVDYFVDQRIVLGRKSS